MQLYIDANIYLEYFRENSTERLAPLSELLKLIKSNKVRLLIPSQTKQEYFRNRRKVAELTRSALVQQSKTSFSVPATLDKRTPEIKKILNEIANLSKAYKMLINKYDHVVDKEKTDADLLINSLFENLGVVLPETESIIQKAYIRYMKGNPPRKNDHSYGDAIIWETLLENGISDNLAIISKDGDFIEKYKGESVLNNFLAIEWRIKTKKKKRARLYKSLAEFVNDFSDKQIIKKEVVDKEKSLYPDIPTISGTYSRNVVSENFRNNSELINPSNSVLNIDSQWYEKYSPLNINAYPENSDYEIVNNALMLNIVNDNKQIYCPYCSSSAVTKSAWTTSFTERVMVCNICHKKFKIHI